MKTIAKVMVFFTFEKISLMSLVITKKTLGKYFSFLSKLDKRSKVRLIKMLTQSMETPVVKTMDIRFLFGAWIDTKESDEIIADIRNTRVEKIMISL
jgi:hypothetical protein